jgi:hypothetical protein
MEDLDEETERRAEKLAREMQKDSRHKELEMADSGMGEEEMFSAVVRTNSNSNNSYPNSPRNTKSSKGGRAQPPRFQRKNLDDGPQNHRSQGGNQSQRIQNGIPPRHARKLCQ